MTFKELIPLTLQTSVALIVFSIALQANPRDITYLLRRPGLLFRSLFAMNVITPLLAAALASAFKLQSSLTFALLALAVSPVPPLVPNRQLKAGGGASTSSGYLRSRRSAQSCSSRRPSSFWVGSFSRPVRMPAVAVARIVAMGVLAPLGAGIIVRLLSKSFAERIARPLSMLATALLIVGFLPVLVISGRAIVEQIGDFALVAITLFVLGGLAVGHMLGGPDPDDRSVLALATATRHPGVAIAIAHFNAADQNAVIAAILLCIISGAIVSLPYLTWRRHQHVQAGSNTGASG